MCWLLVSLWANTNRNALRFVGLVLANSFRKYSRYDRAGLVAKVERLCPCWWEPRLQLLYVLVDQKAEIKAGLLAYVISSVSVPKSSIISPKQHPQMRNKTFSCSRFKVQGSNTDLPTTLLSCNSEKPRQAALSPACCRHTTMERVLHLHIF